MGRLTDEERDDIVRRYVAGEKLIDIWRRYGVPLSYASRLMRKRGLPLRPIGINASGGVGGRRKPAAPKLLKSQDPATYHIRLEKARKRLAKAQRELQKATAHFNQLKSIRKTKAGMDDEADMDEGKH